MTFGAYHVGLMELGAIAIAIGIVQGVCWYRFGR